jgi:hypothetical protein
VSDPAGFYADEDFYYVCPTWKQCRADNGMWQAVPASQHDRDEETEWECDVCHQPINILLDLDTARRELQQ